MAMIWRGGPAGPSEFCLVHVGAASAEAEEVCPGQAAPAQNRPPNRRLAESPYLYPRQKGSVPTHGGSPTGPIPPEETLKRNASPKEKTDAYRREDGVSVFIL